MAHLDSKVKIFVDDLVFNRVFGLLSVQQFSCIPPFLYRLVAFFCSLDSSCLRSRVKRFGFDLCFAPSFSLEQRIYSFAHSRVLVFCDPLFFGHLCFTRSCRQVLGVRVCLLGSRGPVYGLLWDGCPCIIAVDHLGENS